MSYFFCAVTNIIKHGFNFEDENEILQQQQKKTKQKKSIEHLCQRNEAFPLMFSSGFWSRGPET